MLDKWCPSLPIVFTSRSLGGRVRFFFLMSGRADHVNFVSSFDFGFPMLFIYFVWHLSVLNLLNKPALRSMTLPTFGRSLTEFCSKCCFFSVQCSLSFLILLVNFEIWTSKSSKYSLTSPSRKPSIWLSLPLFSAICFLIYFIVSLTIFNC